MDVAKEPLLAIAELGGAAATSKQLNRRANSASEGKTDAVTTRDDSKDRHA
jgi:hypothetical protein